MVYHISGAFFFGATARVLGVLERVGTPPRLLVLDLQGRATDRHHGGAVACHVREQSWAFGNECCFCRGPTNRAPYTQQSRIEATARAILRDRARGGNDGASVKTLRIDVDLQSHITARLGRRGKPLAQVSRQVEAARRFHKQSEPVTATNHGERGLGWTEHSDVLIFRRSIGERAAVGFRGMPFIGSDDEAGQPPERWVTGTLALFDFIFVECFTVARNEGPHDGMFGLVGLQIANTNALFAARAADHLVQQLKSTLGGTRVAVAQVQDQRQRSQPG